MNTLITLRSMTRVLTHIRNVFIGLPMLVIFFVVFFGIFMENHEIKHFAHIGFVLSAVAVLSQGFKLYFETCLTKLGN